MSVGIRALAGYVPQKIVTNDEVSHTTGASQDWIVERTGVETRRFAASEQATSDLAERAIRNLGPIDTRNVRYLIVATSTPDQPQPSTAAILQGRLGWEGVPSFDINAVCSGFVYALVVASRLLSDEDSDGIAIVVGSDRYSGILDMTDRRTASLFGDGAGVAVLGQVPQGYGIRGHCLKTHGKYSDAVGVRVGGTREPTTTKNLAEGGDRFRMDGRIAREYIAQVLPGVVQSALDQSALEISDLSRIFMHQGNVRLVESVADLLDVPRDLVPITADKWGNTAAASIPLTMSDATIENPFIRGEHIMLAAVGGGLTAGAVILTWY